MDYGFYTTVLICIIGVGVIIFSSVRTKNRNNKGNPIQKPDDSKENGSFDTTHIVKTGTHADSGGIICLRKRKLPETENKEAIQP